MWGIDLNTMMLLLIALTNLGTALMVWWGKQDIRKIELATNSMKDALVEATAKASQAEGEIKGRADEKADAAILAEDPVAVEVVRSIPLKLHRS